MYATSILFALSVFFGANAVVPRHGVLPGEFPVEVSPYPTVPTVPPKEKP